MLNYNFPMNNKRLTYFDLAKGFGILLVVLGHIEYISEELRGFISSFHMPLFFIISGMLMAYKYEGDKDLSASIKKKAKGLLIPYMWFSLLYVFIDIFNLLIHAIDGPTFIENIISSATFYGVSVLWFLPALFIGEAGGLFLINKLKKFYLTLPLSLIAAVLVYMGQIKISSIFAQYADVLLITSLINFLRVFIRGIIAVFFVLVGYYVFDLILRGRDGFSLTELILGIVLFISNIFLCLKNGCVDFHYIILKNLPFFFICAIIGSLSIILISKNLRPIDFIQFFGKNSLVIMATHVQCYVLYGAILVSIQVNKLFTHAKSYIFVFSIMVFTMIAETFIVLIINRYFPFMIGKKSKNNHS